MIEGLAVRSLLGRLAVEWADRAEVCEADEPPGWVEIVPRNPRAACLRIDYEPDGGEEVWVGIFVEHEQPGIPAFSEEWEVGTLEDLEALVRAVAAGDVQARFGPGRQMVEVHLADGTVDGSTGYDFPVGCLPLPGWRRRAEVVRFEAYT